MPTLNPSLLSPNLTRTVIGAQLQTAKHLNLPYTVLPNTTINEKYNNHADAALGEGEYPVNFYLGISQVGVKVEDDGDLLTKITPIPFRSRFLDLYKPLPFITRPLTSDLTPQERAKYRMRVVKEINGTIYALYYLLPIDLSFSSIVPIKTRIVNGELIQEEFIPTLDDLNPTPPVIDNNQQNITSNVFYSTRSNVNIEISEELFSEIANSALIINGDSLKSVIKQIGIYTGLDRVVSGTFSTGTSNYTDAVVVQLNGAIPTFLTHELMRGNNTITFDIGATEPDWDPSLV